jgi:hypothetical protein
MPTRYDMKLLLHVCLQQPSTPTSISLLHLHGRQPLCFTDTLQQQQHLSTGSWVQHGEHVFTSNTS